MPLSEPQREAVSPTGRLACHSGTYHSYSLDEALTGISTAGFVSVELSASSWTPHVALEGESGELSAVTGTLERKLLEHHLHAAALSTSCDITTAAGQGRALQAVHAAADLGVSVLNLAIDGQVEGGQAESVLLGDLDVLADTAEKADVRVALEICGRILPSGEKALPLLERIGRASIGVTYDTANVEFYSGNSAVDDLSWILPHVFNVHLKDIAPCRPGCLGYTNSWGTWCLPTIGAGHVDFPSLLSILDKGGYSGTFSVEIEFQQEPWPELSEVNESVRQSHAYLRSLGVS